MIIIGIAGWTGSGKTTVVTKIANNLPQENVIVLPQDAYYKDNSKLTFEERKKNQLWSSKFNWFWTTA